MRSHGKHPIVAYLDENNTLAEVLSDQISQAHMMRWIGGNAYPSPFIMRRKQEDTDILPSEDVTSEEPDIFLMDLSGSQQYYSDVIACCRKLIKDNADLPVLLVIPPERSGEIDHEPLSALLDRSESDCIFSPLQSEEVGFRLKRLWHLRLRQRQQQEPDCLFSHFVPVMRSSKSGRLDAKMTSELFGLTLTETAQILGRQLSTIAKTPDAEALQPGLRPLERIASALLFLTKTPQGLRMWMNAENPEFQGKTPLTMVRGGLGEVVAITLENTIMGQPD